MRDNGLRELSARVAIRTVAFASQFPPTYFKIDTDRIKARGHAQTTAAARSWPRSGNYGLIGAPAERLLLGMSFMKIVNVLSSHYPGSFVSALLEEFKRGLDEKRHVHEDIDLYAENFNPVMAGDDFNQFFGKPLPEDVLRHQAIVKQADALAFFYPVWWNDMPAIMKGWIDRVFSKDFAYELVDGAPRGSLPVKRALLVCTLGNAKENTPPELEEAMRVKERAGVFGFCGVEETEHIFLYNVDGGDAVREECKARVRALAHEL